MDSSQEALYTHHKTRCVRLVEQIFLRMLNSPFDEAFGEFVEATEHFEATVDHEANTALLSLGRRLGNNSRFEQAPLALAQAATQIGELLVNMYIDELGELLADPALSQYRDKFTLNADTRALQANRTAAIIRENFALISERCRDIGLRRAGLKANLPHFEKSLNHSGFDVGHLARNFGAGAMAVMNPLIGVPALIANWKLDADRSEGLQASAEAYQQELADFIDTVQALAGEVIETAKTTASYATEKYRESVEAPVDYVLGELERCGLPTAHFYDYLARDMDELEQLEREYFEEDADA